MFVLLSSKVALFRFWKVREKIEERNWEFGAYKARN